MNAHGSPRDLIGRTIASQFRIVRKLGAGGMGAVYLAEQIDMDRPVVLKVLHPELSAGSPNAVERFKREGRLVARVNHPHIVQVYVFGQIEDGGQLYLAMEFVDGLTLTQAMADGRPMPAARVLRIADQILAALIEAHGQGLVHRDLKPDNIMLTERHGGTDYVKVLDFGIAKMVEERGGTVTEAGSIFGTPRYMSPEQGRGDAVDARTDLYSLGVLLFELLTAHHPFEARSTLDYLLKHQVEPPPPMGERYPELGIPPRLSQLVATLLQKDREQRYASAGEVRQLVHSAMADLPSGVRPWPTPVPGGGSARPAPSPPTTPSAPATPGPLPDSLRPRRPWVVPVAVLGGFGATLGVMWFAGVGEHISARDAGVPVSTTPRSGAAPVSRGTSGQTPSSAPASVVLPPDAGIADAAVPDAQPVPTSDLAAGRDFEGLRLPAGAVVQVETGAIVTLFVDAAPLATLDFFHAEVARLGYQKLDRSRHRLGIDDLASPFEQVFVMAQPHGTLVSLTRNAEHVGAARQLSGPIFGAPVFPDARLVSRTEHNLTYSVRAELQKVFDFHVKALGGLEGVLISRHDQTPASLTFTAPTGRTEWITLNVLPDPTGPEGTVMVIINERRN